MPFRQWLRSVNFAIEGILHAAKTQRHLRYHFYSAAIVVLIGYIILSPYMRDIFQKGLYITKHSKEEISVIAFIIVLILVVITKAYFGKGHPLRGGMLSGHSALAFSVWVAITY